MSYLPKSLSMSPDQARKLSKGDTIRLTPAQLKGGSYNLRLTARQINSITKALQKNVGLTIQLSPKQRRAQPQGSGLAQDLLKAGLNLGKNLLADNAGKILSYGGEKLGDYLGKKMKGGSVMHPDGTFTMSAGQYARKMRGGGPYLVGEK